MDRCRESAHLPYMDEIVSQPEIAFSLDGSPSDEGLVRFADFATFVDGALATLRAIERAKTNSRQVKIDYRIIKLEVGSAALSIQAIDVPELRAIELHVAARLAEGLAAIRDGIPERAKLEPAVQDGLKKMLAPLRRGVRAIVANIGDVSIAISGEPDEFLKLAGLDDETAAVGSFSGSIDALNVHGDYFFYLYPPIGPYRIKCVFANALLDDARASVKRYANVHGLIEYIAPSPFPTRIIVDSLSALPPEAEVPTLSKLWGISPNLTGDMDEIEFVRRLRDAE